MRVVRADVLGFCHGVRRAVNLVEDAVTRCGTVYSLGPIVHNEHVVATLADLGVHVVASLDDVPDDGTVAITAHGAEDVDAPARWLEWFASEQDVRRERDQALPADSDTRGRSKLFKT